MLCVLGHNDNKKSVPTLGSSAMKTKQTVERRRASCGRPEPKEVPPARDSTARAPLRPRVPHAHVRTPPWNCFLGSSAAPPASGASPGPRILPPQPGRPSLLGAAGGGGAEPTHPPGPPPRTCRAHPCARVPAGAGPHGRAGTRSLRRARAAGRGRKSI